MTEREALDMLKAKLKCLELDSDVEGCDGDCEGCEYCYTQGTFGEQKQALATAIKALEKQIPKKVVNIDEFADYAECPSCGAIATDNLGCLYGWCRKCGQKLKRSEEE